MFPPNAGERKPPHKVGLGNGIAAMSADRAKVAEQQLEFLREKWEEEKTREREQSEAKLATKKRKIELYEKCFELESQQYAEEREREMKLQERQTALLERKLEVKRETTSAKINVERQRMRAKQILALHEAWPTLPLSDIKNLLDE